MGVLSVALVGLLAASSQASVTCDAQGKECECGHVRIGPDSWSPPSWMQSNASSLWDISAMMEGEQVPLSKFKAKAALVVNVASAWGLQYQNYPGFKRLLDKYSKLGFTMIAFPCNQFGAQATGSSECEREYIYHKMNVTKNDFPAYDKVIVNGEGSSPVYSFLKGKMMKGDGTFGEVAWNYEKFLVDGNGLPIHRIASQSDPEKLLEGPIRKLLGLTPLGEII